MSGKELLFNLFTLLLGFILVEALSGLMRTLRGFTEHTADQEPKWRHTGTRLDTGYDPPWRE